MDKEKLKMLKLAMFVPAMPMILLEGDPPSISSTMGTALSGVQSDVLGIIGTVLPYALTIVGAVLVVTIGIKVFKRISGK